MSCLLIKNDGVGDLVLTSGLIGGIAQVFGGAVDLVTCSANREIAESIAGVRDIFYVSRDSIGIQRRLCGYGSYCPRADADDIRVLARIHNREYDTAILLRRFVRQSSLAIMKVVRARRKVAAWQFPTNTDVSTAQACSRGWEMVTVPSDSLSELAYLTAFCELVLGISVPSVPRLTFDVEPAVGDKSGHVALGISGASTNWSSGNWLELCGLLLERGWSPVLLGGEDAVLTASFINARHPEVRSLVGKSSWKDSAREIAICGDYIGNDSGLSHLASLFARRCLVILGGGTFRRFFPWPAGVNQYVIYNSMDCFDCDWQCKFPERHCLSLIRPRSVAEYLELIVKEGLNCPRERDVAPQDAHYPAMWRRVPNPSLRSARTGRLYVP